MSNEQAVVDEFKAQIEKAHPNWLVQTEVPVGELSADVRIVEVDEKKIVKSVIAYGEAKGEEADLLRTDNGGRSMFILYRAEWMPCLVDCSSSTS